MSIQEFIYIYILNYNRDIQTIPYIIAMAKKYDAFADVTLCFDVLGLSTPSDDEVCVPFVVWCRPAMYRHSQRSIAIQSSAATNTRSTQFNGTHVSYI